MDKKCRKFSKWLASKDHNIAAPLSPINANQR